MSGASIFALLYLDKQNPFALSDLDHEWQMCLSWIVKQPETDWIMNMLEFFLKRLSRDQINAPLNYVEGELAQTAFTRAVCASRFRIAHRLKEVGADINQQSLTKYLVTCAATTGDITLMDQVIQEFGIQNLPSSAYLDVMTVTAQSPDARCIVWNHLLDLDVSVEPDPLDVRKSTVLHGYCHRPEKFQYCTQLLERILQRSTTEWINALQSVEKPVTPLHCLTLMYDYWSGVRLPFNVYKKMFYLFIQYGATRTVSFAPSSYGDLHERLYDRTQVLLALSIPVTLPRLKTMYTTDTIRMLDSYLFADL